MGMMTQARMAAWQEKAGLTPAHGERVTMLRDLQREAFELIRIAELKRSGIRDGDGAWHGSDALQGTLNEIARLDAALHRLDYAHLKNVPAFDGDEFGKAAPRENNSAEIPF